MSGPGWSVYACLACARLLARSPFAPEWLSEDVAKIDAAEAAAEREEAER